MSSAAGSLIEELTALRPRLHRFALRALRDPEASADLTQETLAVAVAQLSNFDGRSSLQTWVLGILSHKIIDELRRRGTQPAEGADGVELLARPSPEDVERVVGARRDLARVEAALATLPYRERLAILLTDVEGLEREEVCSALAVTATHLRVVLHRGRNRLRRILERA